MQILVYTFIWYLVVACFQLKSTLYCCNVQRIHYVNLPTIFICVTVWTNAACLVKGRHLWPLRWATCNF